MPETERFSPRRLRDVIEEVCRERGDPLPVDVCAEIEEAAAGWGFPRVAVVPGEDEVRSMADFLDDAYFGASVGASPSMAVARALLAAGWTRGGREAAPTPTDAAQAVRALVEAATCYLYSASRPEDAVGIRLFKVLRPFWEGRCKDAALLPFGGAGDAADA